MLLRVSLTISPVKDGHGQIVGASKIARDISQQVKARESIESLNAQLTRKLAAMTRMQQLSTRLVRAGELTDLLGEFLEAAIEITGAHKGNIQLFQDGALKIVQQRGFETPFLDFFDAVHPWQRLGIGIRARNWRACHCGRRCAKPHFYGNAIARCDAGRRRFGGAVDASHQPLGTRAGDAFHSLQRGANRRVFNPPQLNKPHILASFIS
jgi:hypothetical protein